MATTQRLQLGGCQGCHPGIVRRSRRTTSQSIPSVTDQATHNPRPIHHSRCDPSIAPTTKAIGPMVPAIPATSQNAQWAHGGCRSHGRRMETVFPTGWAPSTESLTVVISWPGGYAAARSGRRFGRQGTPRSIRSRSHLATRGRPTGRPHRRGVPIVRIGRGRAVAWRRRRSSRPARLSRATGTVAGRRDRRSNVASGADSRFGDGRPDPSPNRECMFHTRPPSRLPGTVARLRRARKEHLWASKNPPTWRAFILSG